MEMNTKIYVENVIKQRRLAIAIASGVFVLKSGAIIINKKKRRHRWWVHPINKKRLQLGDWDNLIQEMRLYDEMLFFNYTRLNIHQFDKLLALIKNRIMKINTFRASNPPGARLAITLRHLSTGDSLPSISYSFRIDKTTACNIIRETCEAIWEILSPVYLKFPSQEEEWKKIAFDFEKIWNLPHCLGAIDGKHCVIQAPKNTGSQYYNYKKQFSIVFFGICDANYKFIYVDIGAYGSQSDGGVLRESIFGNKLLNGGLNLPSDNNISDTDICTPYFFVGDEAFPLTTNLMRPYGGTQLSRDKRIFNYRLSRARRCIENTFGILVSRFRIFHRVINANPNTVDAIIKVTVVLHNFILSNKTIEHRYCPVNYVDRYDSSGNIIPGDWHRSMPEYTALQNIRQLKRRLGTRNASATAEKHRNDLKEYFHSPGGAVSWQDSII